MLGCLEVISGPMFAGKTEELLKRINRFIYEDKKFLLFKPDIDNRYSTDLVVSHSKRSYSSIILKINFESELYNYIEKDTKIIIIDEVQFFSNNLVNIIKDLLKKGFLIICAGLDLDFRGEPFLIMPTLLALATKVMKLTSVCSVCKMEATRSQRLINGLPAKYNDDLILIGEVESYEPRCINHHEVVIE